MFFLYIYMYVYMRNPTTGQTRTYDNNTFFSGHIFSALLSKAFLKNIVSEGFI